MGPEYVNESVKFFCNRKHPFKREQHSGCNTCHIPITVQNIFIDCLQYDNQRKPITEYVITSNLPKGLWCILNDDFPYYHLNMR